MVEIVADRAGLMTIKVSDEVLELFRRLRWYLKVNGGERLRCGQLLHLRDGAKLAPYVGFYEGDQVPQWGHFSYSSSKLDRMMSIGAYCSISWNVRVLGVYHPLDWFSTTGGLYQGHSMFRAAFDDAGAKVAHRENPQKAMPVIGNDVWIGQEVLLGRGITIGDGAVVAAGSVVVKDVLPYQIVGGSPAKHIRYRFAADEQALLQNSRWWEYHLPGLSACPVDDISGFVAAMDEGVRSGRIFKVARFEETLAGLVRSGRVSSFLADEGQSILQPAVPGPATQKRRLDVRARRA